MSRHVVFGTGQIGRLVAERLVRPGVTQSALGGSVFGTAVSGRTAQVMGHPDLEHSYSYAPDVAAGRTTLRLIGIVNPAMREYLHTLYQFSERWVVDDTAFRAAPASREPNPSSAG